MLSCLRSRLRPVLVLTGVLTTLALGLPAAAPAGAAPSTGLLRVITSPPVPARVFVDGLPADDWGLSWVTVPSGSHEVCFSDIPGFLTPPCQTVAVAGGATTLVEGVFTRLGLLQVKTEPAGLPATIFVDGLPRDEYGLYAFFETGQHQVCWGDVVGWTAPACQTVTVAAGAQMTVSGTFTSGSGPTGPAPALGPFGVLRVTTNPPVVSRISVDGVPRADWGLTFVKFPVGSHEVCFADVPGFTAPPCQTVTVGQGATATVAGQFTRLGLLKVEVAPAGLPVDIVVDGVHRDQFGLYASLEVGTYQVCTTDVAGWRTPACVSATVAAGTQKLVTLTYTSTRRFDTVAVGGALPSDAACTSLVRRGGAEVRPANATFNQTKGHPTQSEPPFHETYGRVTGSFAGTTDEIIQWTACKWGIDEDVVRAQVAKESYWFQRNLGDFGSDPTRCLPGHPIGADGRPGQCPESVGLMQVRYPYFQNVITDSVASSAYNLDISYAVWRACFEGDEWWLNTVERGKEYAAGDLWGCVGRWFSGRWYTQPANDYIAAVQDWLAQRIWETPGFISYTG